VVELDVLNAVAVDLVVVDSVVKHGRTVFQLEDNVISGVAEHAEGDGLLGRHRCPRHQHQHVVPQQHLHVGIT